MLTLVNAFAAQLAEHWATANHAKSLKRATRIAAEIFGSGCCGEIGTFKRRALIGSMFCGSDGSLNRIHGALDVVGFDGELKHTIFLLKRSEYSY
jgi:hypothetical protein